MKPFIVHLLTLLAICFVLSCCKHEPPTEPVKECQYDSSIEEMKKWYYFKTGTWWVYEEQTTGDLDTITVYYDWEGTNGNGTFGFETWGNSSKDGFNYKYYFNSSFSIHCLNTEECICHKVGRAKTQPGNYIGEEWLFLYPIIEENYNNIVGYPNGQITAGTTSISDVDLTFNLTTDTIYEVVKWEITTDQSIAGWPSVYYFVKNYGILQFDYPHTSESWKLIANQIVQ